MRYQTQYGQAQKNEHRNSKAWHRPHSLINLLQLLSVMLRFNESVSVGTVVDKASCV